MKIEVDKQFIDDVDIAITVIQQKERNPNWVITKPAQECIDRVKVRVREINHDIWVKQGRPMANNKPIEL